MSNRNTGKRRCEKCGTDYTIGPYSAHIRANEHKWGIEEKLKEAEDTEQAESESEDRLGDAIVSLFWQYNAVAVDEDGNVLGIVGR